MRDFLQSEQQKLCRLKKLLGSGKLEIECVLKGLFLGTHNIPRGESCTF
jgi:hypothetical protein